MVLSPSPERTAATSDSSVSSSQTRLKWKLPSIPASSTTGFRSAISSIRTKRFTGAFRTSIRRSCIRESPAPAAVASRNLAGRPSAASSTHTSVSRVSRRNCTPSAASIPSSFTPSFVSTRNSGSPRNSTTRPLPWFSTTAHAVFASSRSVLSGQTKPASNRESAANATGLAPPCDGFQNVDPSRNTGSWSCS